MSQNWVRIGRECLVSGSNSQTDLLFVWVEKLQLPDTWKGHLKKVRSNAKLPFHTLQIYNRATADDWSRRSLVLCFVCTSHHFLPFLMQHECIRAFNRVSFAWNIPSWKCREQYSLQWNSVECSDAFMLHQEEQKMMTCANKTQHQGSTGSIVGRCPIVTL